MKILAIETSCDETATAVLEIKNNNFEILTNIIASSVDIQAKYGGIVPEVAARKQIEFIIPVLQKALGKIDIKDIDYIAVTSGPGLITSLRVGVETAKTLSYIWQKPLIEINHMEGHMYVAQLNKLQITNYKLQKLEPIIFPALALLVSGGHTQLILIKDYGHYKIIGETLDDAVGEAFDKVAKILDLGYPGGPIISKLAIKGDNQAINFPRPMINSKDYNFSFSGIKTSVLYLSQKTHKAQKHTKHKKQFIYDVCASFQQACVEVLIKKTVQAAAEFKVKTILLGGGVSANKELRKQLTDQVQKKINKVEVLMPQIKLTGDNALMIALAAYYKIKSKKFSDWRKIKVDPNVKL